MAIILAENSCFLQKTTIKTKMYLVHAACQYFVYQLKSPFKKSGTDFLSVPAAYSYFKISSDFITRFLYELYFPYLEKYSCAICRDIFNLI